MIEIRAIGNPAIGNPAIGNRGDWKPGE